MNWIDWLCVIAFFIPPVLGAIFLDSPWDAQSKVAEYDFKMKLKDQERMRKGGGHDLF